MKAKIVLIACIGLSIVACAQQKNEDFVIGKWVVYKTTNQNGDSLTVLGTEYSNRPDTLEFLPKGELNVYYIPIPGEPPMKSKYLFRNDSTLLLGKQEYIFRIIDEDRMILDDNGFPNNKQLRRREYWRRVEE